MTVRRLSVSALIGLVLGSPSVVRRYDPATLLPLRAAHLPASLLGYAWARHGDTLAIVVKPTATGEPVRILDARTLRTRRLLDVGDRDVCGLTFQGAALVALAADRPCYAPQPRFSILRFGRRGIPTVTPVARLASVPIPNLVFGDGHAYVARPNGAVDAVDLRTGRTTTHRPRRVLAKGERIVAAAWLGRHRMGVGGTVVDVVTWKAHVALAGATGVAGDAHVLVAWRARGATAFIGGGSDPILPDDHIDGAVVAWPYFYARVGEATDVVDLRSTRSRPRVVPGAVVFLAG
jgi:hypothetical protein